MTTLPYAREYVVESASASAGGTDLICVWAPVTTNADATPRIFGSAADIVAFHGYSEGAEYAAYHRELTGKSVLFCGLPIATPGVLSRQNTKGNTGSSATTLSVGSDGVLAEHDGAIRVKTGGTVGTDQIVLEVSLDGGRTYKPVRLGKATSYAIPYSGVTLSLTAGTLVAGDYVHTWHGSSPRSDAEGWIAAKEAIASQLKTFRTGILVHGVADSTEANAVLAQFDALKSATDRATLVRASVPDRLPLASLSKTLVKLTGDPSLTFADGGESNDTITRATGSFVTDGFKAGMTLSISGTTSNNKSAVVSAVSASVLEFSSGTLAAEGPKTGVTITGVDSLVFAEVGSTGDTITRSSGSWIVDGFCSGCSVNVSGTLYNNFTNATVTAVTDLVLTLGAQDLTAETVSAYAATVTVGQTPAAWMATTDAAFASVDGAPRLNLSAGYARRISPLSGWYHRRPVAWAVSCREYQHDLHIPSWRHDDGPIGWDIFDANGALVEWDDRVYGGAGCGARLTTLKTRANGPAGAFVALDLTRQSDGSLLTLHPNMNVVNLAVNTVHKAAENIIGRSLVLNRDGTATGAALAAIQAEVNAALRLALLTDHGEGQRCSIADWEVSKDDILNIAEAQLTGVLTLQLNGIVHSVVTSVRILSGGQE